MCTTLFKNARLILPTGIFLGELLVRDDKIEAVSINHALPHFEAQHTVDVNGKYLSPGFIETHTHGAGGFDFMDGDLDSMAHAGLIFVTEPQASFQPPSPAPKLPCWSLSNCSIR